jgi:hypothetical protein
MRSQELIRHLLSAAAPCKLELKTKALSGLFWAGKLLLA